MSMMLSNTFKDKAKLDSARNIMNKIIFTGLSDEKTALKSRI